jgi:hypothetical protein
MTSLREGIRRLPRFPLDRTVNVSDVAQFVGMPRPISVRAQIDRLNSIPESVPFHQTIETGAALGGELDLVLRNDGSYTFSGFMRATGFPSFTYRLVAIVRSSNNQVTVVAPHSGEVFGTDTPGDRQDTWNEVATDPDQMKQIRNIWPDISGGTMVVNRSSELSGVLDAAVDIVKDVAELFLAAETLGVGVAVCLVVGSELNRAGVTLLGLGGVVGLGVVGGVVYIFGPGAIIPAIVLGVAVGEIVDAMVHLRSLRDDEIAFARQVFGDSLDFGRIRVTNLSGLGGRAFTTPTVDGTILLNLGNSADAPAVAVFPRAYPVAGQILIHELVRAWQIEHASLADGYIPGLMCTGILNQTVVSDAKTQTGPAALRAIHAGDGPGVLGACHGNGFSGVVGESATGPGVSGSSTSFRGRRCEDASRARRAAGHPCR